MDFAGWAMPVQYTSIVEEHVATRTAATLFDVSHMGRLEFRGPDAARWLDGLLTRPASRLQPQQVRYALVTNDAGGILDDVLVYRHGSADGDFFSLVVNASNRQKIVDWISAHASSTDAEFRDRTLETAMIAVQGPSAVGLVNGLVNIDVADIPYYECRSATFDGLPLLVSRTGYTGEDGCELIVESPEALRVWTWLLQAGQAVGARAAGLGARDTLRLEAAMPLYGHELDEATDPYQAGLSFAVRIKDRDFVGRDALAQRKSDASLPIRVGLTLDGRRAAREGYAITHEGKAVGTVTSGTFSPTLQQPIAMGYVPTPLATPGTELHIDIRGREHAARVVPLPFYQRETTS